ncbi:Transcription elongation factor GreA [Mycoplasmopsis meleagridis]|uniref:Transcription elongation factor GreA n=1 Tax=Mycoplasmopsis meleagridis ATCC 25294 TaxID=1264554 RepID=A0A0F5H0W9_9BACT|nr:transcription elongation factor GreA [Mycoplasmopsis meleagridis]KKB26853.1 Transcription elongation factor GreA [Mycoplasmopsis meleagridis ATCC 25294]OAD18589.1 Transcription elongation factor GreA [Mycoplasmopsis meleagridis]VEU77408.1 transcription elongation factor GreA [Mycoplasmopsis meleagridis]
MTVDEKEKILLTQETYDKYKAEYDNLILVQRPAVQAELKEARAQGDLSENAEYDAARDKQAQIEGRILELEEILEKAQVYESDSKKNKKTAGIGAKVTYLNLNDNKEYTVSIMGSHDSNPFENKISDVSPLAQAIMEISIGEIVEVDVPKKYSIKLLNIE